MNYCTHSETLAPMSPGFIYDLDRGNIALPQKMAAAISRNAPQSITACDFNFVPVFTTFYLR